MALTEAEQDRQDYPATAAFVDAWQAKAPGHNVRTKHELGYARSVCARCEVQWPCPDVRQAMQAVNDQMVLP